MRKRFAGLLFALIVAFSFGSYRASAAHLMGGDLTYKYLGNNTYALKFLIYRDASCTMCANMPASITYYSYAGSYVAKSDYSVFTTHTIKLFSIGLVQPVAPHCASPSGVSVQQGIYLDTLTPGNDSLGYHITWFSNGFRNSSIILNLVSTTTGSGAVPFGMIWYTFIPNNKYGNSTPQFLDNPIPYLCVGQTNTILPTCSDANNDSLVYSLEVPFSPPAGVGASSAPTPYPLGHPNFQQVVYKTGFSPSDPFGTGSTSISIDPQTGVITAKPTKQGAYVIAIQVKEYRYDPVYKKSVYLDFVRRDLEFLVGAGCPSSAPPAFISSPSSSKLIVAPGDSLVFDIVGASANGTDTVYLSASGGVFNDSLKTISAPYATFTGKPSLTGAGKVDGHFVWKPSCQQITYSSPFTVTFNLSDQSCHTIYQTYQIEVQPRPILTPPLLKCASITNGNTISLGLLDSATKPEFLQYKVYRDTGYSTHFKLIDSISSFTKTSYTDSKASTNKSTVYSYYITSQNNCGLEGLPSDTVSNIVLKLKPIGDKRVNITWNAPSTHLKHKYQLYDGLSPALAFVDSVPVKNPSYTLASCSGTYRFKVQMLDSSGTCTSNSGDTVLINLHDTTPPDIDTNLVNSTTMTNSSIKLTFNRSDSNDTHFYKIYRSVNGGSFSQIDSVKHVIGQKQYQYTDSHSLDALNNHYCYEIKGVDSCDNVSKASNTICQSYLNGSAGQLSDQLSWHYTYSVHTSWVLQKNSGTGWATVLLNPIVTSYTDNSLICNHAYQYRIMETDNKSDTSFSDVLSLTPFDSVTPPKPLIYNVSVTKNHSITLSWNKNLPKVKAYIIYRKASGAATFTDIDTVKNDTSFTDKGKIRPDSVSYCYEVQAMDSCSGLLSKVSSPVCSIYLNTNAPGCLQKIFLQWTLYTGWPSGVSKYEVFRKTDNGAAALIATTTSSIDSFTDFSVSNKHRYIYYIEAFEKNGTFVSYSDSSVNSPFKPTTPYITNASKVITSATVGQVDVRWQSQATPHIQFSRLFYKPYGSGSFVLLKDNIPVSTDSFVHTGLNTNTNDEEYRLVSYDSCGNVSDSSTIHKTMDLQIKVGQLVHYVNWTPYLGWPVKEYLMQMMVSGKFVTVDSVPGADTSKTRFPAPCNHDIFYRILAKSYKGDIAMSDTAGAKAIDTIPSNAPAFIYTSVLGTKANIMVFGGADSSDTYGYGVYRSDNGGSFAPVAFIPYTGPGQTLYYIDTVVTTNVRHCYYITTMDSCLNTTYSDTFCPVFLTGKALNQAASLRFAPFKGYPIQNYQLQTWVNNGWQTIITKTGIDTMYADTPLACYVPRYYRVVANPVSALNYVSYSDSIMLLPFDTIVPGAPVMHYASALPGTGYKLEWHWDKKSDVKYFEIWRAAGGGTPKYVKTLTYDSTTVDTLSPVNAIYRYYVIAIDSCDPSHRSKPSITQTTMKLAEDAGACGVQVALNWSGYTGFASGTKAYQVYRSGGGAGQTLIATVNVPTTSYTDASVSTGVKYTYQIRAVDSLGNEASWSDTISAMPFVFPVPKAIQLKRATVLKTAVNGDMLIEWNYLDRTDPYAVGYKLYGANSATGPFALIDSEADKNVNAFVQTNVNTLTGSFYYYITPYNICNKAGSPSAIHHAVNMKVANQNLEAKITWNKYGGFNVGYYLVYKAIGGAGLLPTFKLPPTDSSYSDTNIYCHNSYTYQVVAVDTADNLTSSSDSLTIQAFDTTAPSPAYLRSASVSVTDEKTGQVLINFNTVNDKNLEGYVVYRSVNSGTYNAIDTLKYNGKGIYQYFDNSLNTTRDTFSYFFKSFDSCGNTALPADTHTVVHLTVYALNNVNQLAWSAYKGFPKTEYVVYRKTGTGAWGQVAVLNSTVSGYLDTNVYCHVFYTYKVLARNTTSGVDSAFSNTDTATAFKTTPPQAPEIIDASVTVTGNTLGQVQVNWFVSTSFDVARYVVYRRNNGNAWQKIILLPNNVFTYTDINLDTHNWPYDYMVRAVDSCGNISVDNGIFHRTVNLQTTPINQAILLNWNTYRGFPTNRYDLYKNGKYLKTFDSLTLTYKDTMVHCPTLYVYMIKAIGFDTVSWSNHDSAVPIDTTPPLPPRIKTVTVSIHNSTVDIFWQMPQNDVFGYKIFRQTGDGALTAIASNNNITDSIYTDQIALNGEPLCYEVVAYDACGNTSLPGNQGCVINLHGKVKSLEHDLDWNKYQLWTDSVDYYNVYRNDDNGGWIPIAKVPASDIGYVDKDLASMVKDFCYRVEAVEKTGLYNATSWSTVVCLNQPPIVYVPNAFTPDYSFNLNDYFGPSGTYFKDYDMKIYDRWGQLIYNTSEGRPWDGTAHGSPAAIGVYMYQIDIHGYNGNIYTFKGNVEIVN